MCLINLKYLDITTKSEIKDLCSDPEKERNIIPREKWYDVKFIVCSKGDHASVSLSEY